MAVLAFDTGGTYTDSAIVDLETGKVMMGPYFRSMRRGLRHGTDGRGVEMRKGVVVCGANGERGVFPEKAMEKFSKLNLACGKSLQFSVRRWASPPS